MTLPKHCSGQKKSACNDTTKELFKQMFCPLSHYDNLIEFLDFEEASDCIYPLKVSMLTNPTFYNVDCALIIDETFTAQKTYRLLTQRRFKIICDRRFESEKEVRRAFTFIFSIKSNAVFPQVWTPFLKADLEWLQKNFRGMSWELSDEDSRSVLQNSLLETESDTFSVFGDPESKWIYDTLNVPEVNYYDGISAQEEVDGTVKISLLNNPSPFFVSGAYLVRYIKKSTGSYRLTVFRRTYLIIDQTFDCSEDAKEFFAETFALYKRMSPGPLWSQFRYPPRGWLGQKLKQLN